MTMTIGESSNEGEEMKNALRWIGELDHPFYDDERQRFIWYEASTIALQVLLFANVALVGAMLWIGGAEAIPYALAVFVVQSVAVLIAVAYAKSNFAEYIPKPGEVASGRNILYAAFVLFAGGGFVRALLDSQATGGEGAADSFFGGAASGAIIGIVIAPFIAGIVIISKRRKQAQEDELDEF